MISGNEIRFRAAEREDLPRFVAWLNDPEVRHGLQLFLPQSMAEEEQWYERMINAPKAEHVLVIEIFDSPEWVTIGTCGFHEIDWRARCAEVGILIGEKPFWNRGYGTQVMRLLLRHGFNTLNLNRISLRVFSSNPRAIRCYQKAGFVHEGQQRQAYYQDGDYLDVLLMSVIRTEWKE